MPIQPIGRVTTEIPDSVMHDAVRCWRSARAEGRPATPCLHALLAPRGLEMLTPVLAGLLEVCERFLDRDLRAGSARAPSADETLLCKLIADPSATARIAGGDLASVLVSALRSTRAMMTLAAPAT